MFGEWPRACSIGVISPKQETYNGEAVWWLDPAGVSGFVFPDP